MPGWPSASSPRALANGGDFAEVFAERSAGLTMAIDESRIEAVQAGRERWAPGCG